MTQQSLTNARTATLTGPKQIEVRDTKLSAPDTGEVLLQTLFSGISAGTEMNVYRGSAPLWHTKRNPESGLFEPNENPDWIYPLAYGYAAVSKVAALGTGVSELKVGELVYSYTPHSSGTVVSAASVVKLPKLIDPRVGVLNANLNTAYNGILDARPNLGDVVVVSGLGVIGLIQVQLLAKLGCRIIGVDEVTERRTLAERFGAEFTFTPGAGVAAEVRALTNNRGADIVIEVSGASIALNDAIRIVGYNGTVIAMSWYGGTFENLSLAGEFHHNRPRVISSQVGGLNPELGPLWSVERRQEQVSKYFTELELQPLLTHTLPIEKAAEAYQIVDSRPDDLVQLVLAY